MGTTLTGREIVVADAPAASSRRAFVLGGLVAMAAGTSAVLQPRFEVTAVRDGADIGAAIPGNVAGWSVVPDYGVVAPPDDESMAAKDYAATVTRTYASTIDPTIMFVLAYAPSQSGTLIVHRPEICYPGAGFQITDDRAVSVPLAPGIAPPARFLSTRLGARVEQVLYWTRLGDSFPGSWGDAHIELAWQNLRGIVPDGALARLSIISDDAAAAFLTMTRFAAALYAVAGRDGRALLAGPANVAPGPAR